MMLDAAIYKKTMKMMGATLSETFKVPFHQLRRVFYHGLILACIILGFWLLDSLKDPILANTIGLEYQPIAKLGSVVFTLFIVCIYDFLTSVVSKVALFHIVSWVFGVVIMIMAALLSNPVYGLRQQDMQSTSLEASESGALDDIALAISTSSRYSNALITSSTYQQQSPSDPSPASPAYNFNMDSHRYIGFFAYFTIEAYGSLMVALFWSFTNSITNLEDAKGAYGLIIALAQIGAILGSTLATNASRIGIPQLFVVGSISIFSISLLMKAYFIVFDDKYMRSQQQQSDIDLPGTINQRVRSMSESIIPLESGKNNGEDFLGNNSNLDIINSSSSSSSSSGSSSSSSSSNISFGDELLMTPEEQRNRRNPASYLDDDDDDDDDDNPFAAKHSSSSSSIYSSRKSIKSNSYSNSYNSRDNRQFDTYSTIASSSQSASTSFAGDSYWTAFLSAVSRFFAGFYEGLVLILQHEYTLKILVVSCLYEIVVTVLDYEFKILAADAVAHNSQVEDVSVATMAHHTFRTNVDRPLVDQDKFANLLGHFGQFTNIISLFVSFFLFSLLNNKLGVQYTLMIFPVFVLVAVLFVHLVPTLWILFVFVSITKALIFSLHDPTKELLYQPTSEPIKFKAKAWIDVFGSRFAKAIGSLITNYSRGNAVKLQHISELPCLVIASVLVYVAWSIGKDFQRLIDSKQKVGDE